MIFITGVVQGTYEWRKLRSGMVTGTRLASVMGTPWDRLQLIAELIAEEGTESLKETRVTPEMERGSAEEAFAVRAYQEKTGQKVDKVGMCISTEFDWFGVSPDGLIKEKGKYRGGIEVKSPDSKTLIMYKMVNMIPTLNLSSSRQSFLGVPNDYKWQVVAQFLANDDLEWLDFVVWDPRFISEEQKLYTVRVERTHPDLQNSLVEARKGLMDFREDWVRYRDVVLPSGF